MVLRSKPTKIKIFSRKLNGNLKTKPMRAA